MKKLRKFFMEDYLEFNRNIIYNFAESGMMPRKLKDVISELNPNAVHELLNISFEDSPNWGRGDLRDLVAEMHPGAVRENVLITTGTSEAIFLLFRQIKPKKIALIFPAYQLLYEIPLQQDAEIIDLPIHWDAKGNPYYEEGQWLEIIREQRPDVILINNPHNPSGILLANQTLENILQVAKEIDATIIGDEHYRFLASEDSLLGKTLYRNNQKCFVTGSYMKCLGMSGIRVGWCVGDQTTLAKMQNEKIYITHVVSPITEWISLKILSDAKNSLFSKAREEWKKNKEIFSKYISDNEYIIAAVPQGGLVTCVGFKNITDNKKLGDFLQKAIDSKIFFLPLSSMEIGIFQKKSSIPIEINYGVRLGLGLKPNLFVEGLNVLTDCIKSMPK